MKGLKVKVLVELGRICAGRSGQVIAEAPRFPFFMDFWVSVRLYTSLATVTNMYTYIYIYICAYMKVSAIAEMP